MKKEYKNQILVADKIFITPEFKRTKKVYKWNFILSVFCVCCLFSYYIYAEYDKNKSEEVSKTLLSEVEFEDNSEITGTIRTKDNVIIVILDPNEQGEEVNIDNLSPQDNSSTKIQIDQSVYTAKDGTDYSTVAIIDIPKIDVHYPIIAPLDKNLEDYTAILKISPCRYYGPEPNEVGNFCIVGHNYRNSKFFSKVPTLENGDIITITDTKDRVINYKVYDKYIVDPSNQDCTDQNTNGRREITIITCTNDSKQRWILKCVEE